MENSVVSEGARGHLFLTGGAQSVLEYLLGQRAIHPGIRRIFRDNIQFRRKFCDQLGARYVHIVCPDKHSVLKDEFPYQPKLLVGESFKLQFGDLFVFPCEELSYLKAGDTYWKTDTHWNLLGRIVFLQVALLNLGFKQDDIDAVTQKILQSTEKIEGFSGDLGTKMEPRPVETGIVHKRLPEIRTWSNRVSGSNGAIIISMNPNAPAGRLLILCDSFGMLCLDLLGLVFREILLLRTPFFHQEIVTSFAPSHVLTSNVERYLPSTPTDAEAPVALLMPSLLQKPLSPDDGFYEALNAQLRPGTPIYKRFINGL